MNIWYTIAIIFGAIFYFASYFIFENKISSDKTEMYFNQTWLIIMVATFVVLGEIEIAKQGVKDFIETKCNKE